MLLLPIGAPLAGGVARALDALALPTLASEVGWVDGAVAFGAVGQADPLDDAHDPSVALEPLAEALARQGIPRATTPHLARAIANREGVLSIDATGARSAPARGPRPPTLFERAALVDVLGDVAATELRWARLTLEPTGPNDQLNHFQARGDRGVIRLLPTNGVTLAGRTHAVVHELGHALIAALRRSGMHYRAAYGEADYGRYLDEPFEARLVDEESWVRALADAWLLRRRAVRWSRVHPGAVDRACIDRDADALAAWVRARLRQGLGIPAEPVEVPRSSGSTPASE